MIRIISAITSLLFLMVLASCGGGGGGGGGNDDGNNQSSSGGNNPSSSTAAVNCNNDQGAAISARNNTSHRIGQSCLTCHKSGGSAVAFTVAGTVFKSGGTAGNQNATVRLYTHNSNTIVSTLVTDKCGNFYTTATVPGLFVAGGPLVNGVDVVVEDSAGGLHTMPGLITGGGCNGCHGATNGKIIAN
jgi:large repetitive protein